VWEVIPDSRPGLLIEEIAAAAELDEKAAGKAVGDLYNGGRGMLARATADGKGSPKRYWKKERAG